MTAPQMEFSVPVEVFLGLLSRVKDVVERRSNIPILSHAMIEVADDGRLVVEASDIELWARAESEPGVADVVCPGATTVSASLMLDALKRMPKGKARFGSTGKMATLSCGVVRIRLHEMPVDDWPAAAIRPDEPSVRLSLLPDQLRAIPEAVEFAIARDKGRPFLEGALLEPKVIDGDLHLVAFATDGHRASRIIQSAEGDFAAMPRVILSRKTLRHLPGIADRTPETSRIEIDVTDRRVIFTAPGFRLYARLLDFTYPDYERILPSEPTHSVELETQPLRDAVERVRIVAGEKEKEKVAALEFSNGRLALSMSSAEAGDCSDEIAAHGDAFAMRLGFQSQYILDILSTVSASRIRLGLIDNAAGVRFDIPGNDARIMVVMPYALDKRPGG